MAELDYSDIAAHRGEQLGSGTMYFRDHFLGRDQAVTTGFYTTGAGTKAELATLADEAPAGATAPWDGTALPRLISRVTALGGGKAERVTRYGFPRFGDISRINQVFRARSTRVEKPWLLAATGGDGGYPVISGGELLAYVKAGSGHLLPVQRFSETLVHITFTERSDQENSWNTYDQMIDRINDQTYTIDPGGQGFPDSIVFGVRTLRFNGVEFFTRSENGGTSWYNVFSFTWSSFGWRYQHIPPTGSPPAPVVNPTPTNVVNGRLYEGTTFLALPT